MYCKYVHYSGICNSKRRKASSNVKGWIRWIMIGTDMMEGHAAMMHKRTSWQGKKLVLYSWLKQQVVKFCRRCDWIQIFMCVCICYIVVYIYIYMQVRTLLESIEGYALLLTTGHFSIGLFQGTFIFFCACIQHCMWIDFKIRRYVDLKQKWNWLLDTLQEW